MTFPAGGRLRARSNRDVRAGLSSILVLAITLTSACKDECARLYDRIEACGLADRLAPDGQQHFVQHCRAGSEHPLRATRCVDRKGCPGMSACLRDLGKQRVKTELLERLQAAQAARRWNRGLAACELGRASFDDPAIVAACDEFVDVAIDGLSQAIDNARKAGQTPLESCIDLRRMAQRLPESRRLRVMRVCDYDGPADVQRTDTNSATR